MKLLLLCTGASLGVPAVGYAQTDGANAETSDGQQRGLDVIIVTARKKSEALSDVPVAISAFSNQELQERQVRDLSDVALLTPGLSFESFTGGGFGTPVIRGATQQNITVLEQNVSVFLDGVYIPRAYAIDIGVFNLDRLEVVKGPQGALYGQNSFMGSINYITRTPGSRLEAQALATVASDEFYEAQGYIGGPIVSDLLAIGVEGSFTSFDGTRRNNHPLADAGISGFNTSGNLGGWERWNVGAKLVFTPTDTLTIDASYRHFDNKNEASARYNITPTAFTRSPPQVSTVTPNCGTPFNIFGEPGFGLFCGELPTADRDRLAQDPRQFGTVSETDFYASNILWEPVDDFSIKYSFGRIKAEALQIQALFDFNLLTPGSTLTFNLTPFGDFSYTQHELRASYAISDALELSLGGFTSRTNDEDAIGRGPAQPTLETNQLTVDQFPIRLTDARTEIDTEAVFGSASLSFLEEKARLTMEGRLTWQEKRQINNLSGATREVSERFFDPRIILDYRLYDDVLVYASLATGTKAGGVNIDPAAYLAVGGLIEAERTFDRDKNRTFEVGTKARLHERVYMELAAFYIDWDNMQISSPSTPPPGAAVDPERPPAITLNLGSATIQGIEWAFVYDVNDTLRLNLGGSYVDSTFDDGVFGFRTAALCDGNVCDDFIGGNQLPRAPSTNMFGGFQYEVPAPLPFASDAAFYLRGDISYQSKQYADETNTAFIPSRTIVNLSTGFSTDRFDLRLWVRNLTNADYVTSSLFIPSDTFGASYTPVLGQLRTFGITATTNF
ncbi:MAG: TonB-dependent receptor [Gammaproteobacteria bacterium]|nr:TonB-dependent receptor [Gammaproteobacteria bacterium]